MCLRPTWSSPENLTRRGLSSGSEDHHEERRAYPEATALGKGEDEKDDDSAVIMWQADLSTRYAFQVARRVDREGCEVVNHPPPLPRRAAMRCDLRALVIKETDQFPDHRRHHTLDRFPSACRVVMTPSTVWRT